MIGRGFEGFELPPAPGLRQVPAFEDFQINQAGRLPRRVVVEPIAPVDPGPAIVGRGFDRDRITSMLDNPAVANVGRYVMLGVPGAATGQSAPILEARCSDQRSRQLTITLTAEMISGADRDASVIVTWGAGGVQAPAARIDLVNGTTFSVIGSFLRILGVLEASPANQIRVGAFIGYEPRAAGSAVRGPQRTIKTAAIVAGNTSDVTIPPYATSVSYMRNPLTTAITLSFLDGSANVIGIRPIAAGTDDSPSVIPIPNNAVTLRVAAAAVDQIAGRAIFGLCL